MMTMTYQWVASDEQLANVCAVARQQQAVALDTEFIRTRTFYAQLGLIQLFDGVQLSLIDPLAIQDFSPFVALLADQAVVKILHSCSEDLEVFQQQFNQLPTPLADTQIMAGFVGIGVSMGFAKLVAHYFGIELDKGASRTDWLARPLSEKQLQYAAADVWYLLPLYQKLQADLALTRWKMAVEEECQSQLDRRLVVFDPQQAYRDISGAWQLEPAQLAVLQVLAKWRVEEAKKRNLALNFVVKEQSLLQIAQEQPRHTSQLLVFMQPNEVRIHGKKLLWLVEQGQGIAPELYPNKISRLIDDPHYKKAIKALQNKLSEIQPNDLAMELLANKRQLNQLFKWHSKGRKSDAYPALLTGWRKVFGEQLLDTLSESFCSI